MAQTHKVSGIVTDAEGEPISGASVLIKGTQQGTTSGNDGSFSISANPTDVLVISSVDFSPYTVKVGTRSSVSIKLAKVNSQLSEVVVTALGIKRQAKELGYATTSIKSAQLNQAAVVNPATGLAAKISGVDIRVADNGVNPQVKVTFRGSRSIEGDNSALIVVDGVPVDHTYLANLNPSDIQDVTVLKGSNASALYGMAASNGVMLITTKKGKGTFSLTYANTVSFESISYFPQLQNEYSGFGDDGFGQVPNPATPGQPYYYVNPFSGLANAVPYENEAYGQAFSNLDNPIDSILIGVNANQQFIYGPFKDVPKGREDFFQTGIGDQNKLSGSMSNKWGGLYFSGEHTTKQGVVPMDTYSRNGGRVNGNVTFGKFSANGGISYNNTSTDISGNSYNQNRPVYWNVMNQQDNIDLKSIQNINLFQNNQGYINAFYPNPWWQIYNSRAKTSTNQLVANLQLNYKLTDWLSVTARGGYSRSSEDAPAYIDSISWPSWLTNVFFNNIPWFYGTYNPGNLGYQSEDIKDHYSDANGDLFFTVTKKVNKFKFNLIAGGNYRTRSSFGEWFSNQVNSGANFAGANFIPNTYTKVTDSTGAAHATYSYERNDQSLYGDLTIGYANWLFLHGSFRNDWTSILAPDERSFSYPSIDLSAVLSDKISAIKNSRTVSFLKVRVGYAGTGNVSLDGYTDLGVMGNIAGGSNGYFGGFSASIPNFGAYAIYPLTSVAPGYPFGSGGNSYSQSYTSVQNNLQPEKTQSVETGFELGLFKNRVNIDANYYDQVSTNQTIPVQTSLSSGIANFITNAGKVNNSGVEVDLHLTPLIQTGSFRFDVDFNFAYQNSKVVNILDNSVELDPITTSNGQSLGGIYALAGKAYPQIEATDFYRDPKGRVIVDGTTGLPTVNPNPVDAGQANYKYFYGLTPKFTYKNLTLTAVFDYRAGAKIMNSIGTSLDFAGISSSDAANRSAFVVPNSVINTGTSANPNYVVNSNVPITTPVPGGNIANENWWTAIYSNVGMPYVTSADFIKLREVALTYDVPKRFLGTQKVFKALSLSFIGRNLFMWRPKTNIWSDPEFSTNATGNAVGYTTEYQTPPTRVLSVTISATIF